MGFGRGGQQTPGRADTVTLVVQNAAGDTVRTMRVSGTPGVHWVSWDLRKNRAPLGPAARRDSIRTAERQRVVRDSVAAALRADTSGARRQRPGAARDPEPGEPGTAVLPTPPGGLAGGRGGFGAGGGFGGQQTVEPGDYRVTLRIGNVEVHRVIRVERVGNTPQSVLSGGVR
jgi:hypothetical protein